MNSSILILVYTILTFFMNGEAIGQEKYNERFSIACHNCYEPQYATGIEQVLEQTTNIELDIWDNEIWSGLAGQWAHSKKLDNDWYVKHSPSHRGNLNCCGGTLRTCLERIKVWSQGNPTHQVITVFIDKKENWSDPDEKRKPIDFDNLLLSVFPLEKLISPRDLIKTEQLKRELKIDWPSLESLKGKIIFVITDGTELTSRRPLKEYLDLQGNSAVCFVAPEIQFVHEITQTPGFSESDSNSIFFFNLQYKNRAIGNHVHSANCVSRIYGSPENPETFNDLKNLKINFIAFYNYKLN